MAWDKAAKPAGKKQDAKSGCARIKNTSQKPLVNPSNMVADPVSRKTPKIVLWAPSLSEHQPAAKTTTGHPILDMAISILVNTLIVWRSDLPSISYLWEQLSAANLPQKD